MILGINNPRIYGIDTEKAELESQVKEQTRDATSVQVACLLFLGCHPEHSRRDRSKCFRKI
jgi:hypothetical protein